MIGGRPTMKLSRGSGKATLPGRLQVWRSPGASYVGERDLVGLMHEEHPGQPLLHVVWDERGPRPMPTLSEVRTHAAAELATLSEAAWRPREVALHVSDPLAALVESLTR
jgi:nicotinate phosphoribosyltransferase